MKSPAKLLLCLGMLLLFFAPMAEAQILQTRDEVVKTYGEPFSEGVTKRGETYLFYKIPVSTKSSGKYIQRKVLFFRNPGNGIETCYKWKIIEPVSEAGDNILSFNNNLVQLGDLKWKDYDKGIFYEMEVGSKTCRIKATYDNEVSLAKVYKVN